jgi:hypothetical protein
MAGPRIWNNLDSCTRASISIHSFKRALKKYCWMNRIYWWTSLITIYNNTYVLFIVFISYNSLLSLLLSPFHYWHLIIRGWLDKPTRLLHLLNQLFQFI